MERRDEGAPEPGRGRALGGPSHARQHVCRQRLRGGMPGGARPSIGLNGKGGCNGQVRRLPLRLATVCGCRAEGFLGLPGKRDGCPAIDALSRARAQV